MTACWYCVVIGDVVGSRHLPNRGSFQQLFFQALDTVNGEFRTHLVSRLTVTLGDEFQGVLGTPVPSFRMIARIQDLLRPVPLRFGVGLGEIVTEVRPEAVGMDGPAFHRAREALEEARELGGSRVRIRGGQGSFAVVVNALLGLMWLQRERWSPEQRRVVELVTGGLSQRKVARRLAMTESNVSQLLKRARLLEMREADQALERLLAAGFGLGDEGGERAARNHTL